VLLKGILPPKLTFKWLQTFRNFFLLVNTKEYILRNVGNQTVDGPIDFYITLKVNGPHQLFGYPFFNMIIFCVQQKKETHSGLEPLEGV